MCSGQCVGSVLTRVGEWEDGSKTTQHHGGHREHGEEQESVGEGQGRIGKHCGSWGSMGRYRAG